MNVRIGDFAVYQGQEYKASKIFKQNNVKLISKNADDQQRGFAPVLGSNNTVFSKIAPIEELEDAYSVRTLAQYKGQQFLLMQDNRGGLALQYHGMGFDTKVAEDMGFKMIERGIYELEVQPEELELIWEEKRGIWGFTERTPGLMG